MINFTKSIILSSIAFSAVLSSTLPSVAANNKIDKSQEKYAEEFRTEEVRQYQSLPDVPQYTGQAVFVKGIVVPQAKGGTSSTYNLAVRENRQAVMQWYQDSLKLYKWTMDSEQTPECIRANKGGNFVQILVGPPSRMGFGSDILITYRTSRQ